MNQLTSESQLREERVEELATMIDAAAAERAQKTVRQSLAEDTPHGDIEDDSEARYRAFTDIDTT